MSKREQQNTWMHFSIAHMVVLGVFCICVIYMIFSLANYGAEEKAEYQEMVHGDDKAKQASNDYTSRQHRKGLQKDILFTDKGTRLQLRLRSVRSELALHRKNDRTEIVEQMHLVNCYLQEELLFQLPDGRMAVQQPDGRLLLKGANAQEAASWVSHDASGLKPVQVIVFLEADEATYQYKNDAFIAENVKLTRYLAPSHFLMEGLGQLKILSSGMAKTVEFSLAGKGINFKANQFKAKFFAPVKR